MRTVGALRTPCVVSERHRINHVLLLAAFGAHDLDLRKVAVMVQHELPDGAFVESLEVRMLVIENSSRQLHKAGHGAARAIRKDLFAQRTDPHRRREDHNTATAESKLCWCLVDLDLAGPCRLVVVHLGFRSEFGESRQVDLICLLVRGNHRSRATIKRPWLGVEIHEHLPRGLREASGANLGQGGRELSLLGVGAQYLCQLDRDSGNFPPNLRLESPGVFLWCGKLAKVATQKQLQTAESLLRLPPRSSADGI
mmetsp:Transcript_61211/g.85128  ORF Transcript_61211/g.85128 Transcript_61211/m.85128 type:complete len:254 (+) Transcript_61211:360-1121(+)